MNKQLKRAVALAMASFMMLFSGMGAFPAMPFDWGFSLTPVAHAVNIVEKPNGYVNYWGLSSENIDTINDALARQELPWNPEIKAPLEKKLYIESVDDWNAMTATWRAANCYAGFTVYLCNNITLGQNVQIVDDFKGTFEGQGFTITLPKDAYFATFESNVTAVTGKAVQITSSPSVLGGRIVGVYDRPFKESDKGKDIGLFCNVWGDGEIKDLTVALSGNLFTHQTSVDGFGEVDMGSRADAPNNVGILVGEMGDNAKITNCAIVQNAANARVNLISNNTQSRVDAGGVVGEMGGNASINGLYMNIDVGAFTWLDLGANVGGIVGNIRSNAVSIANVNVDDVRVASYCGTGADNTVRLGGVAGLLQTYDQVSSSKIQTSLGRYVAGTFDVYYTAKQYAEKELKAEVFTPNTTCESIALYSANNNRYQIAGDANSYEYSSDAIAKSMFATAYYGHTQQTTSYPSNVKYASASALGSAWVQTASGSPNLAQVVTEIPSGLVRLEAVDGATDYQNTGAYNIIVDKGIWNNGVNSFVYSLKANIMGKQPTTGEYAVTVSAPEIANSSTLTAAHTGNYYAGGSYAFSASFSGVNVDATGNVTWTVTADSGATTNIPTITATTTNGDSNGAVMTVPDGFAGSVTVRATCPVVTGASVWSEETRITIENPLASVAITDGAASASAGTKLAFGGTIGNVLDKASTTHAWSVSGSTSATNGTSIANNGILTIAEDETAASLTVTLTAKKGAVELGSASKAVTVTQKDTTAKTAQTTFDAATETTPDKAAVTVANGGGVVNWTINGSTDVTLTAGEAITITSTAGDGTGTSDYSITAADAIAKKATISLSGATAGTYTASYTVTEEPEPDTSGGGNGGTQTEITDGDTNTPTTPTTPTTPITKTYTNILNVTEEAAPSTPSALTVTTTAMTGDHSAEAADGSTTLAKQEYTYTATLQSPSADYQLAYQLLSDKPTSALAENEWIPYTTQSAEIALNASKNKYVAVRVQGTDDYRASDALVYAIVYSGASSKATLVETYENIIPGIAAAVTATQTEIVLDEREGQRVNKSTNDDVKLEFTSGDTVWNLATGQVVVSVYPVVTKEYQSDAVAYEGFSKNFYTESTYAQVVGSAAQAPVISPGVGETVTADAITISIPKSTTVYYETATSFDGAADPDKQSAQYTAGMKIPFPTDATEFEVKAIAYSTVSGIAPSSVSMMRYAQTDLQRPDAPTLKLDGKTFSQNNYYQITNEISFHHSNLSGGVIYYEIGKDPSVSSYQYDASAPNTLAIAGDGRSNVELRVMYYETATKLYSEIVTYHINLTTQLNTPQASLASDVKIRPQEDLTFTLSQETIDMLNTTHPEIKKVVYAPETDTVTGEVPSDAMYPIEVTVIGDTPMEGVAYISYDAATENEIQLPSIRYYNGETDSASNIKTNYRYGLRKVSRTYEVARVQGEVKTLLTEGTTDTLTITNYTYTDANGASYAVRYESASTGTAVYYYGNSEVVLVDLTENGAKTTYMLKQSEVDAAADGFDIRDKGTWETNGVSSTAIGTVDSTKTTTGNKLFTYYSETKSTSGDSVMVKEVAADGTVTYYEVDGAQNLGAVIDSSEIQTVAYYVVDYTNPDVITLKGSTDDKISVTAITIFEDDAFISSDLEVYTFTVRGKALAPEIFPATTTDEPKNIDVGEPIILSSKTPNAQVLYTKDGSDPLTIFDEASGAWVPAYLKNGVLTADIPAAGATAEEIAAYEKQGSTYPYSSTAGLRIENDKEAIVQIHALTITTDDTLEPSEISYFRYYVNPLPAAEAPTSYPVTSADAPVALASGNKITLRTATTGAYIFYTTNGTVPEVETYRTRYEAVQTAQKAVTDAGENATAAQKEALTNAQEALEALATKLYDATMQIPMAADTNGEFVINAIASDNFEKEQYSDSPVATFIYSLELAKAPTANPVTSADAIASVVNGSAIKLQSETIGMVVYYTVDGSVPDVEAVRALYAARDAITDTASPAYKTAQDTIDAHATQICDSKNPVIAAAKNGQISINAIAADSPAQTARTYANSPVQTFTYHLQAADVPTVLPATTPESPVTLANGSEVTFQMPTIGTVVYYTLNGAAPNVAGLRALYETRDAATSEADKAAAQENIDAYATKICDDANPLYMQAGSNGRMVINAVAADPIGENSYQESAVVTAMYRLEQAATPTSTVITSADAVATVQPEQIINLITTTADTTIYYTVNNSVPSVQTAANGTVTAGANTLVYDAAAGVQIPTNITTFYTIRAIAVADTIVKIDGVDYQQYATSAEAIFTYQMPDPVQAVLASPLGAMNTDTKTLADEAAFEKGTAVTLSTTTEGAVIFYNLYDSKADAEKAWADPSVKPHKSNSQLYTEGTVLTVSDSMWVYAVAMKNNVYSEPTIFGYVDAEQLTAPTTSLPSGSVVAKGTRIFLTGVAGGDVLYTLDGSDPKGAESAPLYGTSIVLDADYGATVTVRAYSKKAGFTPSDIVSFTYTISAEESYLQASPESGTTVQEGDSITLTTGITNGVIYYATGTNILLANNLLDPYEVGDKDKYGYEFTSFEWVKGEGTAVGNTVTVSGAPGSTFIVKAMALANGAQGGSTVVYSYTIAEQTAAPTASIPSGAVVLAGATVALSATEGTIYYTTDGTDPTTSSPLYTEAIPVNDTMTLKIRAYAEGKKASEIVTYKYTKASSVATPVADVEAGEVETGTPITLASATVGATIYYSTDGTVPTEANLSRLTKYTQPISLQRAVTLRAIAVADGYDASGVMTVLYTVTDPPPAPTPAPTPAPFITSTDRLESLRDYTDQEAGPSYSDILLSDAATNVLVAANAGGLPDGVELVVIPVNPSGEQVANAKALGYDLVALYDVALMLNGEAITPTEAFEVGIPIGSKTYNAVMSISKVKDDNTISVCDTRRSGGFGYIVTEEATHYAVLQPESVQASANPFTGNNRARNALIALGVVAAAAFIGLLAVAMRRKKPAPVAPVSSDDAWESKVMQDDGNDVDDFDDFDDFDD